MASQNPPQESRDVVEPPIEGFLWICLETLQRDAIIGFDLYLPPRSAEQPVLYRRTDLAFTWDHYETLRQNGIRSLLIADSDRDAYQLYLAAHAPELLSDPNLPALEKSRIVYAAAHHELAEIYADAASPTAIRRTQALATDLVSLIQSGTRNLAPLLRVMAFDYGTYTHSVNVCILGVALGQRMGLPLHPLRKLASGLLLHDLGKVEIPGEILRKRGPLNPEEWTIMRQHPKLGVHLLSTDRVAPEVAMVVHQHHECVCGGGYPQDLPGERIHQFAKLAKVADVFDALTTRRSYKEALPSFPALHMMQTEMRASFDGRILRELVLMLRVSEDEQDEAQAA